MKQKILIPCVILCSLISGGMWAYLFITFVPQKTDPVVEPVIQEVIERVVEKAPSMQTLEDTIVTKVQDIAPSVVSIIIKKDLVIYRSDPWGFFQEPVGSVKRQVGGGTGFFVRKDGTIITNKHVVSDKDALYTVITNSWVEYDATVIATDPLSDLAIIKIDLEKPAPILELVESTDTIHVGQFAIAIGNALSEFQNSVSLGIVSGKERSIETSGEKISGLLQTDTAINPWNSGGPLVNLDGEVMWINTAIINGSEWIGFAIALTKEKINYMLESINTSGKIKRPFIGISYIPVSPAVQEKLWLGVDYGAYVIDEPGSIIEWSSAQKSGIEPWDIILEINTQTITLKQELWSFIQNSIPGEVLTLKLLKKSGEKKVVKLELGEY